MNKKKIIIITTGGTIAMKKDEVTGALVPALSGEALIDTVPGIDDGAHIEVREFSNIPSEYMTLDRMGALAAFIESLNTDEVDGYVITHGTDTMEETAFFLNHTVHLNKPVCLTGAMRSAAAAGTDGPGNILAAVRAACCDNLYGMGVLVVMNDRVYLADDVVKSHATATDAFTSASFGPVGFVSGDKVVVRKCSQKRWIGNVQDLNARVWIVRCGAGMDDSLLAGVLAAGVDGLIVEGFGCGNVPLGMASALKTMVKKGIPVILTSRTGHGYVEREYGGDGGTAALEDAGVISAGGLSSQKARILLILAIGNHLSSSQISARLGEIQ